MTINAHSERAETGSDGAPATAETAEPDNGPKLNAVLQPA